MIETPKVSLEAFGKIVDEVSRVVVGLAELKELLGVAILSGGHILIEGANGTAKTTIAKSFALALGGEFKRIQFTPDILPSDITGFNIYDLNGKSRFIPGPIFANVVLADELNLTTPRTQSALLEAMQEGQVTVEGVTHTLPQPFLVIATQLKYGAEVTYPFTEVQADRFMLYAESNYPPGAEEVEILRRIDSLDILQIEPVISPAEVIEFRKAVTKVFVSPEIENYIVRIVNHVRGDEDVSSGAGPRASISLYKGARALAFLQERDFVIPDDVKRLIRPVVEHRIHLNQETDIVGEITPRDIIERAIERVPVPRGV